MSAPSDIAIFNDNLTRAKLAALRILQDLMESLADPDAPIPARYRELRLLACAILRTAPMKPALADEHQPPPRRPSVDQSPAPAPTPSHAIDPTPCAPPPQRFNPHQEWARAAIRSLVAAGHLPRPFLTFAASPSRASPSASPTSPRRPP